MRALIKIQFFAFITKYSDLSKLIQKSHDWPNEKIKKRISSKFKFWETIDLKSISTVSDPVSIVGLMLDTVLTDNVYIYAYFYRIKFFFVGAHYCCFTIFIIIIPLIQRIFKIKWNVSINKMNIFIRLSEKKEGMIWNKKNKKKRNLNNFSKWFLNGWNHFEYLAIVKKQHRIIWNKSVKKMV